MGFLVRRIASPEWELSFGLPYTDLLMRRMDEDLGADAKPDDKI
jgi:hypothetical protein